MVFRKSWKEKEKDDFLVLSLVLEFHFLPHIFFLPHNFTSFNFDDALTQKFHSIFFTPRECYSSINGLWRALSPSINPLIQLRPPHWPRTLKRLSGHSAAAACKVETSRQCALDTIYDRPPADEKLKKFEAYWGLAQVWFWWQKYFRASWKPWDKHDKTFRL